MKWTVRRGDVKCGNCPQVIAAGEPVALLTVKELERCASCAGTDVDHAQVDAARHAIEAEDAARAAAPVPVSFATRRPEDGFVPLTAIRPEAEPVASPLPFHKLNVKDRRRHNAIADNQ